KGRLLTHWAEQARRYDEDPLISRVIAVNVLLGLQDTATRLIADAGVIQTPSLILAGGADWVVNLSAEREFYNRLGAENKRMRVFSGMYHDILHEKDCQLVLDEIRGFVCEAFEREEVQRSADESAYTRNEYKRLRVHIPGRSPRSLWFLAQRAFLRTVGKLSAGIRLGWQTGFDSGSSLDYVYENRARGALLLGKIIDRFYLNNIAWAGIRQRKVHVEKLLRNAIERVSDTGAGVRIIDVAAGRGRYVLDTLASLADRNVTAVLRDYSEANIEAGRALAARYGLKGVSFERANAFDEASYASLNPRPNIAIVSGLLELFPDNGPVRLCLAGIADILEEGGYLIYTGQPWHPQIEMIARVLTNREDEPWVMRRRPQSELDALVEEAGFEKIGSEVGRRGIFTVSIAQRRRHGA
ncbi:MAG TPA: class I SAM-dependent methyltransferase family protein, partial [Blastocatellia bacterium]|nr:class I SAM-dependent methyltransferase family protein [Blastocatellia bacterium]